MIYIATYEDYSIRYYEVNCLEEGGEYSVGRSTEQQVRYFEFSSKTISRNQGYIKLKNGIVPFYYDTANSARINRTYLNDDDITGKSTKLDFYNVVAFPCNHSKYAFLLCTTNADWKYCKLRKQNVMVGSKLKTCEIYIEDAPESLFELQYIDQKYFITIPMEMEAESEDEEVLLLDEYGDEVEIENSIEIQLNHIYRIISGEYLFIIGGDVILYGRV